MLNVKIKKLTQDAVVPKYATKDSACFDLVASEDVVITPGATVAVPTGLAVEVPQGYRMTIYPRSGISLKTPLRMANSVGVVDADYRGEVRVLLHNTAERTAYVTADAITLDMQYASLDQQVPIGTFLIRKGDRIAQAAIEKIEQCEFQVVDELSDTERGQGGFGSTGVS